MPALALFLDIAEAIVIIAPSNQILNLQIAWATRDERQNARTLNPFLIGGAIGAVIGTLLLPFLPDRGLRIVLIVIIVAFLVTKVRGGETAEASGPLESDRFSGGAGLVAGLFQGAAGLAGPIVTSWFLSRRLGVEAFVCGVAMAFAVLGFAQLVVLAFQPSNYGDLWFGLILIPFSVAMIPIGARIRERINTAMFETVVLGILVIAAISLLVRVL